MIAVIGQGSFENGFVSSLTWAFDMPNTGSNRLAVLAVHPEDNHTRTGTPTWDGGSLTQIGPTTGDVELWRINNPLFGIHDFAVSFSTTGNPVLGVIIMSGVDLADPIGDIPTGQTGTGLTDTLSFDTVRDNSLLLDAGNWQDSRAVLVPTTPQVEQYDLASTGGGPFNSKLTAAGSTKITTTKGIHTMIYTSDISVNYSYMGVEIKELVVVGGVQRHQVIVD